MAPVFRLRLEHQVIVGPHEVPDPAERRVLRGVVPDLPPLSRGHVRHPEGQVVAPGEAGLLQPRGNGRVRHRLGACGPGPEGQAGTPDKGDAGAVGGPGGLVVPVHPRSHVGHPGTLQVVDPDEGVVLSFTDEGQVAAVGRPDGITVLPPGPEEGLDLLGGLVTGHPRVHRSPVDLTVPGEENPPAVRGEDGVAPLHHPPCLPPRGVDGPDGLLGTQGVRAGVGHPAFPVGEVATNENGDLPVRGEPDVRQVPTPVLRPVGQGHGVEGRGHGRIDVPHSPLEGDPGDTVHVPGRNHLHRKGWTQDVFDGKALGGGRGRKEAQAGQAQKKETPGSRKGTHPDSPVGVFAGQGSVAATHGSAVSVRNP